MQTLQHNCDESYLSQPSKGCVKSFSKVPVNNGGEDLSHSVVIKRVDGYDTHVPSESIWDVITSSTGGTHGRNEELNETWKQKISTYIYILSSTKFKENNDLRFSNGADDLCTRTSRTVAWTRSKQSVFHCQSSFTQCADRQLSNNSGKASKSLALSAIILGKRKLKGCALNTSRLN